MGDILIFPEKHQRRWANDLLLDFDSINLPIIYKNNYYLHLRNETTIFPNKIKSPSHSMSLAVIWIWID